VVMLSVYYANRVRSRKRTITVSRPSVCPSVCPIFFLTLIKRAAHNQRDSLGGNMRRGQRTFRGLRTHLFQRRSLCGSGSSVVAETTAMMTSSDDDFNATPSIADLNDILDSLPAFTGLRSP